LQLLSKANTEGQEPQESFRVPAAGQDWM